MKLFPRLTVAVTALAVNLMATAATAREAVVVLSPVGSVAEKNAEIEAVARHIIDTVDLGETAWVIDGLTQEQIAQYTLTNDPDRYRNERNRMRDNATFFKDLKDYADAAIPPSTDDFAGKIDFPSVLRTVNASYPAEGPRDLIFFAVSPVTHDPREMALSMLDGAIPDDDHVATSRADTPYGASGEQSYLHNYAVHIGTNGVAWQVSDRHSHFMAKYKWLSVTARGGTLATFATDAATALRNAREGITGRIGPFTPERDGNRTMVHFRPTASLDAEAAGLSIYDRALTQRAPDAAELRAAENVELAIRWGCSCDFDLVVHVWGEDPISYRAPRGTSGTLFKDFTSSVSLSSAWETIAMPGPVDLHALTLAVNQFSGASGGAVVELRLAINGETWGRELSIAGPSDLGAGFERTLSRRAAANPAWAVVNPSDIVWGF